MGSVLKRDMPNSSSGSKSAKKTDHSSRHVIPYYPRLGDSMIKQNNPHYGFAESKTTRQKRVRGRDAEDHDDGEETKSTRGKRRRDEDADDYSDASSDFQEKPKDRKRGGCDGAYHQHKSKTNHKAASTPNSLKSSTPRASGGTSQERTSNTNKKAASTHNMLKSRSPLIRLSHQRNTLMLPAQTDHDIMLEVEKIENRTISNLAQNMPNMIVQESAQGSAGYGLFNNTGKAILPGKVLALLSSGKKYGSQPFQSIRDEHGAPGSVLLKCGRFQAYSKTMPEGKHGYMGGAANEDRHGLNNAVIVEIDSKTSDNKHSTATVIISSKHIGPAAEVLVNYGEDPEGHWTHRSLGCPPPGGGGTG